MMTAFLCLTACFAQLPNSPAVSVEFKVEQRAVSKRIRTKLVTPVFKGNSLVAGIANREVSHMMRSGLPGFLEMAREAEEVMDIPNLDLFYEARAIVSVATKDFISLYVQLFDYSGGAHPNTSYTGATWGLVDGEARRMKFADYLPEGADPVDIASKLVVPKLVEMGASWFVSGGVGERRTFLTPEEANNFVVTPRGITWIFSPYEAGPYSDGAFFVKVSWQEIRHELDRKALPARAVRR